MNYEKKYKELVGEIRKAYLYAQTDSTKAVLEDILPELKEPEDERIRQKILFLFYAWRNNEQVNIPNKKEIEKAIAWLEKQKEYESTDFEYVWDRTDCGELTSALDKYSEEAIINMCHAWYDKGIELERKKQSEQQASYTSIVETGDGGINALVTRELPTDGEQKPSDKVAPKFKVGDKIYLKPEYRMPDDDTPIANTVKEIRRIDDKHYRFDGSYIFIEDQDKYELVEQKPEENKGNIGGISAEWSENDKAFLDDILCKLEHDLTLNKDEKDWLKSLKGRVKPQWKPSDEQMELLSEVQSALLGKDCHNRFTGFMWELKKLKEGKV